MGTPAGFVFGAALGPPGPQQFRLFTFTVYPFEPAAPRGPHPRQPGSTARPRPPLPSAHRGGAWPLPWRPEGIRLPRRKAGGSHASQGALRMRPSRTAGQ